MKNVCFDNNRISVLLSEEIVLSSEYPHPYSD
jgi:hypothetical protein